jgi:8-oxo-dGTP pyrophosphatase MutT (NUDIX family)
MIPTARPCTTVLLVRDGTEGLEVLMVVRHERSHFASALVFPGGGIDAEDADEAWLDLIDGAAELDEVERARRIAGFRELYEETGVLLLDSPDRWPEPAGDGGAASFLEMVRS